MIFSSGNLQTAFVSSCDLFAVEKKALPGVTVYSDEETAKVHSIQRKGMIAGKQWHVVEIPPADTFLCRSRPVTEQPFPVLHRLLSQKSLSLLFADELAVFQWQLSCYLMDKSPEEAEALSAEETTAFYHEKRSVLLALASGEALVNFVKEKAARKAPEVIASFFSVLRISGITSETDGARAFIIFDPRASLRIMSLRRDALPRPAIPPLRSNHA
jgi:hypothetical protein